MTNELTSALAAYRFYRSELRVQAINAKDPKNKSLTPDEWETLNYAFIIARNNLVEASKKENIKDIDDVNEELIFDARQRYRKEKIANMNIAIGKFIGRILFITAFFGTVFLVKWVLKLDYITALLSMLTIFILNVSYLYVKKGIVK